MPNPSRLILDDDDSPVPTVLTSATAIRHGYEWGVASCVLGGIFLILAPLNLHYWSELRMSSRWSLLELLSVGSTIGGIAICAIGILFAIRGLKHARKEREPLAMPMTGLVLCFASLLAWIVTAFVIADVMDGAGYR